MNDTSGYIQSFEHIPGTWDDVSRILDGDGKDKAFDITANIFKMYVSDDYHGWFGLFAAVESCIFIHVLRRGVRQLSGQLLCAVRYRTVLQLLFHDAAVVCRGASVRRHNIHQRGKNDPLYPFVSLCGAVPQQCVSVHPGLFHGNRQGRGAPSRT